MLSSLKCKVTEKCFDCFSDVLIGNSAVDRLDNWGDTFVYLCSQTIRTIDFERNYAEHKYMNRSHPIVELDTSLETVVDGHEKNILPT